MSHAKPTLYTLHTGINEYAAGSNVPSLKGCVNDAEALAAFVEKHFSEDYRIESKLLLNGQATYANLVAHLGSEHLGKAGRGDIVFFTYSGHGSKERSAPEFMDPGGKGETLVCYDSRPDGKDLADKELAVLVQRLEAKGAYVVTLLDCCHSGSGFRSNEATLGAARQCYDRSDQRPLDTYLDGHYARLMAAGQPLVVPNPQQLNLAACDRSEKAYEHGTHGLFTYCLLQVLNETPRISYAKLFVRCSQRMSQIADRQHPRFEPSGFFDSYDLFLRPGDTAEEIRNSLIFKLGAWKVNLGSLHGVPSAPDRPVTFAIFNKGETEPVAHADALKVGFQETTVRFDGDPGQDYDAKLISLPEPAIGVFSDQNFDKRLREIQEKYPEVKPVYAALSTSGEGLTYALEYVPGQILIKNQVSGALVKGFKTAKTGEREHTLFRAAFEALDHVARWERLLRLEKSSRALQSLDFKFELVTKNTEGQEVAASDLATIGIYGRDGVFDEKPPFTLRLTNPCDRELEYTVLYLQEEFSAQVLCSEKIPAGAVKDVFSNTLQLGKGKYEYQFHLKLVVSTEKIEGQLMEQKALKDVGTIENIDMRGGISMEDEEKLPVEDLFVKTLSVRLLGIDREVNP